MKFELKMMVGQTQAFCLEAIVPDSIVSHNSVKKVLVKSCLDLAEEQIKEARGLIGDMLIGNAPVVTHDFHVVRHGDKKNRHRDGRDRRDFREKGE